MQTHSKTLTIAQNITMAFFCLAVGQSSAGTVADTCVAGTLADYESLGSSGCTISGVKFSDFRYREDAYGGISAKLASSISVNPMFGATAGFDIIGDWRISGSQATWAQVAYQMTVVDPMVDHISQLNIALDDYHAEYSGRAYSDILGCHGSFGALPPKPSFAPVCDTGQYTLGFFIYGDYRGQILSRSLGINEKGSVDVHQDFSLIYDFGSTPLTSLSGVTTQFTISLVPEPGTLFMVGSFFLAVALTKKIRTT